MSRKPQQKLRKGWTTGACATAATSAALTGLITGEFPDPVTITLPKGQTPAFALATEERGEYWACAAIIKDAGDDPDVTHQALIASKVRFGKAGSGIVFKAGKGVGRITKAGLPIAPGEPAINPVPRLMMAQVVEEIAQKHNVSRDVEIEVSVADGENLALKTWNPRLGIIGGLSILGTTGIVHPFSCSAWIHSIHSGIDVARANGFDHVAAATGSTSETRWRKLPSPAALANSPNWRKDISICIQAALRCPLTGWPMRLSRSVEMMIFKNTQARAIQLWKC